MRLDKLSIKIKVMILLFAVLSTSGVIMATFHHQSLLNKTLDGQRSNRQNSISSNGVLKMAAKDEPSNTKDAGVTASKPATNTSSSQPATVTSTPATKPAAIATQAKPIPTTVSSADVGSNAAYANPETSYGIAITPPPTRTSGYARDTEAQYKLTASGIDYSDVRLGPCTISGPVGSFAKTNCGIEVLQNGNGNLYVSFDADAPDGNYTVSLLARYGGTSKTATFGFSVVGGYIRT